MPSLKPLRKEKLSETHNTSAAALERISSQLNSDSLRLMLPPMFKLLAVDKRHVCYLILLGGLLATVTAGSQCLNVVINNVQDPAKMLRLSNTVIRLLQHPKEAKSRTKKKLKRLYIIDRSTHFTVQEASHSFLASLWFPESLEKYTNLKATPMNCIAIKRLRTYYIFFNAQRCPSIVMLSVRGIKIILYRASVDLEWLSIFNRRAQARGETILFFMSEPTGHFRKTLDVNDAGNKAGNGFLNDEVNDATNEAPHEQRPTSLTLGSLGLLAVLLWMLSPHIAVCVGICLSCRLLSTQYSLS